MFNLTTNDLTNLLILFGILLGVYFVLRIFIYPTTKKLASKTSTYMDDLFLDKKFLNRFSYVIIFVIFNFLRSAEQFNLSFLESEIFTRLLDALFSLAVGLTVLELLTVLNKLSESIESLKNKPIKGYVQIVKIIVTSFIAIIIFAIITGQSVAYYISGLGALTAVLLLIFQDTILSFVASVQIGQNDIIKIGDWIEVPEFGADGDVVDIALHTVKVQNWDKTITTIPTSKIVNTSVKNWRAMSEYGGRRIKRSLLIDISSIKFLNKTELEELEKIAPLKKYITSKIEEVDKFNNSISESDASQEIRRLTNIGTYRAYVESYLKQNSNLNTDTMTFLVRQLPSSPEGVPIEIYTFTNTTEWVKYEQIQSDIFDHLFAILPKFGLRVFQNGLLEAVAMKNLPFNQIDE
jgi:miniconductance mechanosensitive channel|tara:strand:+ start:1624 stop:2844 length:1221 start_codon:yes stop_codon:yes gene_type:complete